jgi:ribosome biogenesis GTPase A
MQMAELTKVQRCYHCGVILQSDDPSKPGYIERATLEKYPEGLLLCDDCFSNQRFSSKPKEPDFEDGYQKILEEIRDKKALVVYVIDSFSFEGSFIAKVNEMLKGIDVFVVATKRDLLPPNTDEKALKDYVTHRLRIVNLDVKDVIIASTNEDYNVDIMYSRILKMSNKRDVYFIGANESGKSALITELLRKYKNNTRYFVTTYTFKGTNLRGFKIPIGNNTFIYETPGTGVQNSLLSKVDLSAKNAIVPKKSVAPFVKKLEKDHVLLFGGVAAVELLSDKATNVTIFRSDKVKLFYKKGDPVKLIDFVIKKKKSSPLSDNISNSADFDAFDFQITETGGRDIGILGLGWLSFEGDKQTFRVFVPKGVYVYTTRAKIKYVGQ